MSFPSQSLLAESFVQIVPDGIQEVRGVHIVFIQLATAR